MLSQLCGDDRLRGGNGALLLMACGEGRPAALSFNGVVSQEQKRGQCFRTLRINRKLHAALYVKSMSAVDDAACLVKDG